MMSRMIWYVRCKIQKMMFKRNLIESVMREEKEKEKKTKEKKCNGEIKIMNEVKERVKSIKESKIKWQINTQINKSIYRQRINKSKKNKI